MFGRIRFYDFRCFRREQPATLELLDGFTSFIGPNNAGKSTLIKSIYELRQAFRPLSNWEQNPTQFTQISHQWNIPVPLHEHGEVVTDRDDPICAIELEPIVPGGQGGSYVTKARMEFSLPYHLFRIRLFSTDGRELAVPKSTTAITIKPSNGTFTIANGETFDMGPLMEFAAALEKAQYFGPFRNAINEGAGGHFDSQIGTGFINQWHQWKTGPSKKQNRAIERVTEDVRRLIGATTLEINASIELKTLQIVVDRKPLKLQELGAGFSQLVVVLGNALIREPSFILIDEPELHLHPALQSDFLMTLATYADYGVLYTTHSMGLARLADRCYTVQKKMERSVVCSFDRTSNYAEFLGSLGIAGLMELGWDRILLVEGTKDVRTMQQFLRLYEKDLKTIVLPLGGDSMVNGKVSHELSEVRRLCDRVFAVVDSERTEEGADPLNARKKFAEICEELKIQCLVTKRRAIENYISQQALDAVWSGGKYTELAPYAEPPKDGAFWGKGESWKAAARMTREELDSTDIGLFLGGVL